MAAADRDLLFGLLALQVGLIDQAQLVAAFQAWTRAKDRPMAEHLVARGDLDADDRVVVQAMVAHHLKKHGGDAERSLAAIPARRSLRESLAQVGDPDVDASIAHVGPGLTQAGEDLDSTVSYSVGAATSDGQRFRILRPHAKGGLGAVFVALDSELHRNVACNLALASTIADPAEGPAGADRQRLDKDRAVATIRRAVKLGFAGSNMLKTDPDFDSLQSRPDFQALLMDLAFPVDPFARTR